MISVEFKCDTPGCTAGGNGTPAGESVDVYRDNWSGEVRLSGYLPEGWSVRSRTNDGLAVAWCPKCTAERAA